MSNGLADRKPEHLRQDVREAWEAMQALCFAEGIDLLLTEGWRSPSRQDWLYASGRTRPGPILTYARRGESSHNWTENGQPASKAFDVCFITQRNSTGKPIAISYDGPWGRVAQIAQECGLLWGGDWSAPKRDRPHFYVE